MDERDYKALNATEKIQNGTILVAKQRCTMISGQDALIIGKEYTAENVCSKDFTVNSEVSKAHYFSFNNNDGSGCWSDYFDLKTQVTTTNIDFIPKHMTNLTTRNKRGYQIAIILLLLAMLTTFAYVCNKVKMVEMVEPISKEQHLIDSLKFINKAIEVQLGYALADAQSQSARAVKAETAAKQRDTIYLTRIGKIQQAAPIDCQPYLTEMGQECDTLIMMHVFSEMSKDTLLMKKDTVINLYAKKDSISQLVINEQGKEIKQAHKQIKRTKFWGKVAIGAAVVWTGFVMYVTVVK